MGDQPALKNEIAFTRSFSAAAKLRAQGSKAGQLQIFAHTSAFRPGPAYSRSVVMPLRRPTADTVALVNAAVTGVKAIYRPGFNFAKAGVMLLDLQDGDIEQRELDLEPEPVAHGSLMGALDKLNDRYGRGTLVLASAGLKGPQRNFEMRQDLLTPQYTTSWQGVPVAKA